MPKHEHEWRVILEEPHHRRSECVVCGAWFTEKWLPDELAVPGGDLFA